jgi:hypothetical protein
MKRVQFVVNWWLTRPKFMLDEISRTTDKTEFYAVQTSSTLKDTNLLHVTIRDDARTMVLVCMKDNLKPHCIQSSRVLVPAGTIKSTSRRHSIQAVTRVMAYVADAVTL